MIVSSFSRAGFIVLLLTSAAIVKADRGSEVDFTSDVRPILSQYCFKCHGPDVESREGGLRLDLAASAYGEADSGLAAIVKGSAAESELVRRVDADEDERMPPPSANLTLRDEQKEILRKWIESGAEYKQHWAFVAPQKIEPKPARTERWNRSPIDRFVDAKLDEHAIAPNPLASPYTQIRRVSLDLTGLPPTVEQANAFAANPTDEAYEEVVDQLLDSPAYGERWARQWLDLARYSDTNGYEKDRVRSIWPYRDWVVRALRQDMPFDQFTVEQVAGDMLPNPNQDQLIATGFHRNTMLNEEGGIDPLEYRYHAIADRVATTGTVWLGLTVGCAQCHTHKYDPLTHSEYFGLYALLNNADEPELELEPNVTEQERQEIERQIHQLESQLAETWLEKRKHQDPATESIESSLTHWIRERLAATNSWTSLRPEQASSNSPYLTVLDDDSVLVAGDFAKSNLIDLRFAALPKGVTGLRLEALPDPSLPANGPGATFYEGPKGDFFLSEVEFALGDDGLAIVNATQTHASAENAAANCIDGNKQSGWSIDGGQGQRQVAVFELAQPTKAAGPITISMLCERWYASCIGRFRWSYTTTSGQPASDLADDVRKVMSERAETWTVEQRSKVESAFLANAPELKDEHERIAKLRRSLLPTTSTLIFRERDPQHPRKTLRYHRGEYLQPREEVQPHTPAILSHEGQVPKNRLEFARWLVSRDNPLTARVTVNRAWHAFFGRGIVATLQDFGYQGESPTHPELLDYLAVDFMDHGWSLKRLHKQIVLSRTYRQASATNLIRLELDPDNRWYSRGPRTRLEAEMIRDQALAVAGLLSNKRGGPGVFPPQPPQISTEGSFRAFKWKVSSGEDRYRRSLYTFSRRTTPFALTSTFDAPSGEVCLARREVTNSSLQALSILNDVTFLEPARQLGEIFAPMQGDDRQRLQQLFRRVLIRPATSAEIDILESYLGRQRDRINCDGFLPEDLVSVADVTEASKATYNAEVVAWALVARVLLNLDETITK